MVGSGGAFRRQTGCLQQFGASAVFTAATHLLICSGCELVLAHWRLALVSPATWALGVPFFCGWAGQGVARRRHTLLRDSGTSFTCLLQNSWGLRGRLHDMEGQGMESARAALGCCSHWHARGPSASLEERHTAGPRPSTACFVSAACAGMGCGQRPKCHTDFRNGPHTSQSSRRHEVAGSSRPKQQVESVGSAKSLCDGRLCRNLGPPLRPQLSHSVSPLAGSSSQARPTPCGGDCVARTRSRFRRAQRRGPVR